MRVLIKIVASVTAWLVITLVVAASIEITFGEPRPGFVPLATLALLVPVLYIIWRKRPPKSKA